MSSRSTIPTRFSDLGPNNYYNILLNTPPDSIDALCKTTRAFQKECQRQSFKDEYIEKYLTKSEDTEVLKQKTDVYGDKNIFYLDKQSGEVSLPSFIGPAVTIWEEDEYGGLNKRFEEYYIEGNLHRDSVKGVDRPSKTGWDRDGNIDIEEYYINGKLHRDPKEGPAKKIRYDDVGMTEEEYYVNGELHRDPKDGPAVTWWGDDGTKEKEEYYVNGEILSDDEVIEITGRKRFSHIYSKEYFNKLTLNDLKTLARENEINLRSKTRKADMIDILFDELNKCMNIQDKYCGFYL